MNDERAKSKKFFEPASEAEVIDALKDQNTQITMSTKTLGEILTNEDIKIAKQIFKELDEIYAYQKLNTDEGLYSKPAEKIYPSGFNKQEYKTIKKKYGVD